LYIKKSCLTALSYLLINDNDGSEVQMGADHDEKQFNHCVCCGWKQ